MAWFYRMLGVDRVRAAFAKLAESAAAFAADFEEARLKLRGAKPPPAIGGPAAEGGGRKKAKAVTP
jgi:hypothetical protein